VALVALAALVAVIRRASGRGASRRDLMNVSVSRQWLVQHQSHDRT
jgi:hypothetical protein